MASFMRSTTEEITSVLINISRPTAELQISALQEVLQKVKQYGQCRCCWDGPCREPEFDPGVWAQITDSLWAHLLTGLGKFDDQLLCATAFYTTLSVTDVAKKKSYLEKVLEMVQSELARKESGDTDNAETSKVIALMYGIFQSTFLTPTKYYVFKEHTKLDLDSVLNAMVKLLLLMAYDYSKYTYIVFKTLSSLDKIIGYPAQTIVYNKDNSLALLNVTNHNWENPITGVRDLNQKIFNTSITVISERNVPTKCPIPIQISLARWNGEYLSREIMAFSWNKATYLMMTECIVVGWVYYHCWNRRLFNSLYKPGLVAAGADMYYAVLNKTQSQDEWCKIFLETVFGTLNGPSAKAIENWTDYWCLPTLKKYPLLADELVKQLGDMGETELKLFSGLSLLKQSSKLGLVTKKWSSTDCNSVEKYVLLGLDHRNAKIRMLAFDILCVSQGKDMPTKVEYGLVIDYIHNNLNSDCTVLRINMLKSLETLFLHLHMTFLSAVKTQKTWHDGDLLDFCKKYQELIVSSLAMNGNYQRKITSLHLIDTFFKNFSQVKGKRQATTEQPTSIVLTLKEKGQLILLETDVMRTLLSLTNDPADDIRRNAINILLEHYNEQLRETTVFNQVINQALKCLSSKFFYEINCGHSKFDLVIQLLIRNRVTGGTFASVEDVFEYALNNLISEYNSGRTAVESIEKGKQLHSFITLLQSVIQVCQDNFYPISIAPEQFAQILSILKGVSDQFAWEQNDSTSSDFSKMNDMVQNLIKESGSSDAIDDDTKLSGLHQMVLNCLWLNVKASCELSSLVVRCQRQDGSRDVTQAALDVMTRVLETCRHKGAIEAAGVALGKAIRHLTSLPEASSLSSLPLELLERKLQELVSETSAMASVTRRGAGLPIMLHCIVAGDTRKDKPLFQHFMRNVLKACSDTSDISEGPPNETNTEKDIPKAVYIHFMTRIVTDSSLTCDVMFYSAKLAEVAFGNLASPHWQIRNAALQLYGALLPKLIGQKKAAGEDDPFATVACDEFRTHSPKLWKYMTDMINSSTDGDLVQHSNLVPILNVLANLAKRYNFSFDLEKQKDGEGKLFKSLSSLLGSSNYTVRKLAAKAMFNIFTYKEIHKMLIETRCLKNVNAAHGHLLLIGHCIKADKEGLIDNWARYCTDLGPNPEGLFSLFTQFYNEEQFNSEKKPRQQSYVIKLQIVKTFNVLNEYDNCVTTLDELQRNFNAPGVHAWAKKCLEFGFACAPFYDIPELMNIIRIYPKYRYEQPNELRFTRFDSEEYLEIVFNEVVMKRDIPKEVILPMIQVLFTYEDLSNSCITWKMLYELSKRIDPKDIDIRAILNDLINGHKIPHRLRYLVPFAARTVPATGNTQALTRLSDIIYSWTDPQAADYDLRYVAALAVNELGHSFAILPDATKTAVIKSAVILLQDEDEEIRNLTVEFHTNLAKCSRAPHPYICLFRILNVDFLGSILTKQAIERFCSELMDWLNGLSSPARVDNDNPFANDSKNIYLETGVLKQLVSTLKSSQV